MGLLPVPCCYLIMNFVTADCLKQVTVQHRPGGLRQWGIRQSPSDELFCCQNPVVSIMQTVSAQFEPILLLAAVITIRMNLCIAW